tara:strand:- start:421 stop:924 length:504 start_codon:yes stop_codon:yes gene_type:complete
MNNQAKKYRKYYEALDAIGCKHISTPRQIKNGTRVFRLPFKDAWGHDIDFATYESGYVRRLVKVGYCPCYQINKKCKKSRMVKVESGTHKGYYYKRRSNERILIEGNGDRLEYLFNYIIRNFFRAKPKYNRTIDMEWLNFCAKWQYGEFGFNSCTQPQQNNILKSLQ